jgi:hypothetical protein
MIEQFRKSIVFLGYVDEKGNMLPKATGFLVSISNYIHMVTAKHVIVNPINNTITDERLLAFFNTKDGKIQARSIKDFRDRLGLKWIFHQNNTSMSQLFHFFWIFKTMTS